MSDTFSLNRRSFLLSSAMTSAFVAAGLPISASAEEQKQVIASIFGGDYADLMRKIVDDRVMVPEGYEVLQDISTTEARQTKLRTEKMRRQSSFDVAVLADLDMYPMSKIGVLETLDETSIPRLSKIIPALRKSYSAPQLYSYIAILYNPEKITTPPTSYADLWNPAYKGKVGISDVLYTATSAVAALVGGGSMTDFTPGQAKLLELKNEQQAQVLPTNESIATAFKSEDIWITLNYVARGYAWQKAGLNIASAVPVEGSIPIAFELCVPKNAPHKDAAFAYINAALEPDSQTGFSEAIGYLPSVTDAKLDPELQARIGLSEADQAKLRPMDNAYLMENQSAIFDFWNREFKG
ncbi:extracellular solute-binding protein [Martelella alba]|uniref:Extracellular solute-binding protein n=1 Tax=Martelella alba TaxID=2590451 RepID=A0A506TZY1_9HYPH|nr:extracellular solute-binding protein [Martelella alba]TPW26866.1 extracellular solute-binding protein [Martelella alba]